MRLENNLIFMHAEKTAGSAVYAALASQFEEHEICRERHEQISLLPASYLAKFRFFAAHASLEDLAEVPRPSFIMTILRDPVERTLSLYDFWRSFSDEYIEKYNLYGPRLAKALSAEEFFDPKNNWRTHATNRYTELLLGSSTDRSGKELLQDQALRAEKAIAVIETFDFVAVSEAIDESFNQLCKILDIPADILPRNVNISNRNHIKDPQIFEVVERTDLNSDVVDLIAQSNHSDQIIYDHIVARNFPNGINRQLTLDTLAGLTIRRGHSATWYSRPSGGMLLHGPYIRLRPGNYRASVDVSAVRLPDSSGEIEVDIVADHAQLTLGKKRKNIEGAGVTEIDVDFSILKAVNDFEVRVADISGGIECSGKVRLRRL